jgi:hypothetical protein
MYVLAWLALTALVLLWTAALLFLATRTDTDVAGVTTLAGVIGMVLWLVWAYGALEIQVPSEDTTAEITYSHPELALVGLLMAWLPAYLAFTGPFEILRRYRQGEIDDV